MKVFVCIFVCNMFITFEVFYLCIEFIKPFPYEETLTVRCSSLSRNDGWGLWGDTRDRVRVYEKRGFHWW